MILNKFLRVLIFCSEIMMPFTAWADMHNYTITQEQKTEIISAVQKKELYAFREKYKLSIPEANAIEIENAKKLVQLYQLKRIDDNTVEGNSFNGKITLQQARDLAKTVRAMAAPLTKKEKRQRMTFIYCSILYSHIIL